MSEAADAVYGNRFNDDLLTGEGDHKAAQLAYPKMAFAFWFESLVQDFSQLNTQANNTKWQSRRLGLIAIFLGALALYIASAEPLYHDRPWAHYISLFAAITGIAGTVLGLYVVKHSGSKRAWLKIRFQTERMRQFHFQYLTNNLGDFVSAEGDVSKQQVALERRQQFYEAFRTRITSHLNTEFDAVVTEESVSNENWNLLPINDSSASDEVTSKALEEAMRAYRDLRISGQMNYVRHVLRNPYSLTDFPIRKQEKWLSNIGMLCIAGIFAIHMVYAALQAFDPSEALGRIAHLTVIWLAITALTTKALEEGLTPQREVERYENYQNSLYVAQARFDMATTLVDRLAAMHDLERLAYQEMKLFLRGNLSAKYII